MKPYTAHDSARAFHESPARRKALWGPLGSGKSTSALWEFIFQCLESPTPLLGIVVRSSYRALHDTTRRTFFEWFGDVATYRERDDEALITLPNPLDPTKTVTHILAFRAIQAPQDAQKLMSMEPSFVFLEECVPAFASNGVLGAGIPEEIFVLADSRLRQTDAHRYTIVCTFNPPQPTHWTYRRFIAADVDALAAADTAAFWQPPYENKDNLPPGYYDQIRSNMSPDLARRFVEGEVVRAYDGVSVYPECIEGLHIIDKVLRPASDLPVILGFDYGLTPATLVSQILPTGQWLWLAELCSFNAAFDTHLDMLRALLGNLGLEKHDVRSWGDPAGETRSQTDGKTCVELARTHGLQIKPGGVTWQERREAMKQRFNRNIGGGPAVLISRTNCPLASEGLLGGYRYPKANDGTVGVHPIKNEFSHILNAAEYVATREFRLGPFADLIHSGNPIQRAIARYNPFARYQPAAHAPGATWMSR